MSRNRKLAELVANIPIKPPAASFRTHWEAQKSGRHALELLADSVIGCTEAVLLADGFKPDVLAGLVRNGLASLHVERVCADAEWFEIRWLRISDAGRRVIGRR